MFFNQYSYLVTSVFAVALVVVLALSRGVSRRGLLAVAVAVLMAFVGWLATRTGPSTFSNVAQVEAALEGGSPTLVEFYSNY